jgi:hypothetical protein
MYQIFLTNEYLNTDKQVINGGSHYILHILKLEECRTWQKLL